MKFLAGAFVFQENTPRKISYASLITFLAGAFVFQETHPENKLCVSDHVPSRGFCFPGNTPRKKLCVSDHVPSRGFSKKHIPEVSYAALITFLAGAFVFHENTTAKLGDLG